MRQPLCCAHLGKLRLQVVEYPLLRLAAAEHRHLRPQMRNDECVDAGRSGSLHKLADLHAPMDTQRTRVRTVTRNKSEPTTDIMLDASTHSTNSMICVLVCTACMESIQLNLVIN